MDETSSGSVSCYMWHKVEEECGANQIATCIYRELAQLPENVTLNEEVPLRKCKFVQGNKE